MDESPEQPSAGPERSDLQAALARLTALRGDDLLLVASSVLFVVATFLPWYEATIGPLTFSNSAWNAGAPGVLAALCGLATAVLVVPSALGVWRIGRQSVAILAAVAAPATLFFTFLRLVINPPGFTISLPTVDLQIVSRGFGLWAGFALAIAMTVGAGRRYRALTHRPGAE